MPDSMRVVTYTNTRTDDGSTTQTQALGDARPCRLTRMTGSERAYADSITSDAQWRLDCSATVDLSASKDLQVNGESFEIVYVFDGEEWAITTTAYLKKLG